MLLLIDNHTNDSHNNNDQRLVRTLRFRLTRFSAARAVTWPQGTDPVPHGRFPRLDDFTLYICYVMYMLCICICIGMYIHIHIYICVGTVRSYHLQL